MLSFENDYITGAHPKVLEHLMRTNLEPAAGYGFDPYCESARRKIRLECGIPDADVEFLTGGTQTNMIVISTMLRENEGVISARSGHVATHEAGAIEFTGHKVLELDAENGKLNAANVEKYLRDFFADDNNEHMVFPGMVYISHPTEYGTLYTKAELDALSTVCRKYGIPLYLDGARLGYGLMSRASDMTMGDIARLCDVFYIGGTKMGALCGEAVVFTHQNKPRHFMNSVKKRGALLAKGRLVGVQFDALFTDGLYYDIARHAIAMAEELKCLFIEKGLRLFCDSPTNQQFVILENARMAKLKKSVSFSFWEKFDENHTVTRFAACFSTTHEDIEALRKLL